MTDLAQSFTPRETVSELDRYIVGQHDAKRAVAIALRNRWRRQRVDPALRDEIAPKNIILMGPTGCGKTEIARRLAKLAHAPFLKVEATKFTEVGYVGRDVDSMVRDLMEASIKLVKEEALIKVRTRAEEHAEERVLDLLLPPPSRQQSYGNMAFDAREESPPPDQSETREKLRVMLREGQLNDKEVDVEVAGQGTMPMFQMFGQTGMEEMASSLQDALQNALGGSKKKRRKMKIPDAIEAITNDEATKLIDIDQVQRDAVQRAEQSGIIFIDEIDKVAGGGRDGGRGPDVSREGVQRDILPIVEGSTVPTKYGPVKTDHILFIAAGAFHMSKPSDLIPELQGRFPIRVELESLTEKDFVRILKEPENSLTRQYTALLETESVTLDFTDDGLDELARVAAEANRIQENIGARRLYTVMEKLLEEISFSAPDQKGVTVVVNKDLVQERLGPVLESEDLSKFIL
jgi:ATP-dependent HslUV protease ATP-binding subunit HslU